MRWFAVNTVWEKYQRSSIIYMLKSMGKRKQTGRKYSTPPCNSVAAPGPPREVKFGTPSKRSVTLSWKKPLRFGERCTNVQGILFTFLICCNNIHGRTILDFLKPRASCNRQTTPCAWFTALCDDYYDLGPTNFITNFAQLSYIS